MGPGEISNRFPRKIGPALTMHGVFKHTVHEAVLKLWGAGEGEGKEDLKL